MGISYEFSLGSVRAKEKSLLTSADIEQMINMKSEADLVRFLSDKGYGEGDNTDEIIASNTRKMWKYLNGIAPSAEVFYPFLIQNDIHNIKTTLKGIMNEKKYEHLLIEPYTITPKLIKEAFENKKFSLFPEWVAKSAEEAYTLIARTKDARLSDAVIDCAAFRKMLNDADRAKSVFLKEYFSVLAFYADLKTALRAARTTTTVEYLERAIFETDGIDKKKLMQKTMAGSEQLLRYLDSISAYDCKKAMAAFKEKPSELEKFVDNKLMSLAKKMCRITIEGPEPLFGYYLGCEYERRTIHIISGGIKTQTPPEKIRGRLRERYG